MKKNKLIKKSVLIFVVISITSFCYGQFFPGGGYQGGTHGSGGDETYQIFLPQPRNLTAIGGDSEVYLEWDYPFPTGEIKYDDGTAEVWYWLNNPTTTNDLFYVRFNTPITGNITDIAVLNGAVSSIDWEEILICPDDGSGHPDLSNPWETFTSVTVNTSPNVGGEWEILTLTLPFPVLNKDTFYIVTRWPDGSSVGPFIATDNDSNSGRSAWSIDGGSTWNVWPENFIMRAYITDSKGIPMVLKSEDNQNAGYLPVISIADGKKMKIIANKIARHVKVPKISPVKDYSFKSLNGYNIYRSVSSGGPYSYINNTAGLDYTDNIATNDQLYYYVISALYNEGESGYSNEASAYPQAAVNVPFSNSFDIDDGNFYGTGDWQWGVPAYVNGPASAYSSPNVWGTVLNGDYSNSSFSWLILPFNLSEPVIYTLEFANWFNIESGVDFGYFAIDHDNDGIYYILDTYTGNSGGWILENLIIHDSLNSPYSKFAFILESDNTNTDAGFYVDDFNLDMYIDLELKVFLEGPFNGTDMNTEINTILPLNHPYNVLPWNYGGSESVLNIPNSDIVDWLLIELRDAPNAVSAIPSTIVAKQAAFLKKDGSIVGLDGNSNLKFNNSIVQQLFIVLWHRHHLGIMSANPLPGSHGYYTYDFTLSDLQVHGGSAGYVELISGIWGMVSGDANANGTIEINDKSIDWSDKAGKQGYLNADFNMDGQADNPDKNEIWLNNLGKESQVPD